MTSHEHIESTAGISRRTVVRGAAWSLPVIAVAVSAPLAAATTVLPPATDWYTGGSTGIASGAVMVYTLTGQNSEGDQAEIPAGTSVKVTALNGVDLVLTGTPVGCTVTDNGDGTFTVTALPGVSQLEVRFRATGPIGDAAQFEATSPVSPYYDEFKIPITRV